VVWRRGQRLAALSVLVLEPPLRQQGLLAQQLEQPVWLAQAQAPEHQRPQGTSGQQPARAIKSRAGAWVGAN